MLWVSLLGVAASSFPITILGAALPEIATDLGTSNATIGWVLSGPLLAVAVATPIAGKMGDLYGHRRLYLWGFVLSTLFAVATIFAWNATSLIAFRTIGQFTASTTGPASLAILMHLFAGDDRPRALGAWSAVSAASPTIGIVIGGPLVDQFSWRAIFIMQVALALVAIVASYLVLPPTPRKESTSFDVAGSFTLGAGVAALLLAVNRGAVVGFFSFWVVGGVSVGVVLLIAFLRVEEHAEAPLIPLPLLRNPQFSRPIGAQSFIVGPYMGTFVATPIMLERLFGFSTTARGLLMILRPAAFSWASWVGGRHASRFGARTIGVVGAVGVIVGSVLTGVGGTAGLLIFVVLALGIAGAGNGYGRPALLTMVSHAAGEDDLGMSGAAFNVAGQIGGAVWITLMTTFLGESQSPTRFMVAYGVAAAAVIVAVLLLLPLKNTTAARDNEYFWF